MGEKLAKELRAVKYVECSALTQVNFESKKIGIFNKKLDYLVKIPICFICEHALIFAFFFVRILQKGLKNVFDEAILAALEPPEQPKKRKCCIL